MRRKEKRSTQGQHVHNMQCEVCNRYTLQCSPQDKRKGGRLVSAHSLKLYIHVHVLGVVGHSQCKPALLSLLWSHFEVILTLHVACICLTFSSICCSEYMYSMSPYLC